MSYFNGNTTKLPEKLQQCGQGAIMQFLLLAIVEIVAALLLLCACTLLINGLFSLTSVRHYSANTMPDNYFPVLIQDHQQEIYPIDIKKFEPTKHQPVRKPTTLFNEQKGFSVRLHLLENGNYELYADLDTAVSTTRYQIHQQGIEPLYYRIITTLERFLFHSCSHFPYWHYCSG